MDIAVVVNSIQKSLNNSISISNLLGQEIEFVGDVAKSCLDVLKDLMDEKEVTLNENVEKDIPRANEIILINMVLNEVDDEIREFVSNYSLLTFNLGQHFNNERITKSAKALTMLLDYQNCTRDMISAMRVLIKYAEQFNTFNPPAFNISRSYLDLIYNKLEKNGGDKSCE